MRKYNVKTLFFSLLILTVIGYLSEIMMQMYSASLGLKDKKIELHLNKEECIPLSKKCLLDYTVFLPEKRDDNTALVVGRVWNSSKWSCEGKKIFETGNFDKYSPSKKTFNAFYVVKSIFLNTCSSNRLNLKVKYIKSQKKKGIPQGFLYVVSDNYAAKIRDLNQFTFKDYKYFILCAMFFLFIFSFFIAIVNPDSMSKIRKGISFLLFIATLSTTGLIEIALPFEFLIELNGWLGMLSVCILVSYASMYFVEEKTGEKISILQIAILFLLLLITQDRVESWIYYFYISSISSMFLSFYFKNIKLFIFSVLMTLTSFEFSGFKGMPNSYIVPTYLGILIFLENQRAFSSFLKINRVLKLGKKNKLYGRYSSTQMNFHGIIKIFQSWFGIKKITLLSTVDESSILMYCYSSKKMNPEITILKDLPPVFAHVITSGNSLIDVYTDSPLIHSIKKGEGKHRTNSDFFTTLPLYSGREVVGAISITMYSAENFKSSLARSTFLFCLDMLKGLLVESLLTTPKTESLNKLSQLNDEMTNLVLEPHYNNSKVLNIYGELLHNLFGWRVGVFSLNNATYLLTLEDAYNLNPAVEKQIRNGAVYAYKENKQGPIAIAVHDQQPVIIPNTKWLESVVHKYTNRFFEIHKTKTAAFIPVLDNTHERVIGVYWIEGISNNEITYADKEMFSTLMNEISSVLKTRLSKQKLEEFIPKELVSKYLAGEEVIEEDHGYLMMLDLKGSTKLANELGRESYFNLMKSLKIDLNRELLSVGWKFQHFVWDAFEYTKSSNEESDIVESFEAINGLIENVINLWKQRILISNDISKKEIEKVGYRICIGYGDISRGILNEGMTQKWGFCNVTIANVTKVEQAAKKYLGNVYCDATVIGRSRDDWMEIEATSQELKIYGLKNKKYLKAA